MMIMPKVSVRYIMESLLARSFGLMQLRSTTVDDMMMEDECSAGEKNAMIIATSLAFVEEKQQALLHGGGDGGCRHRHRRRRVISRKNPSCNACQQSNNLTMKLSPKITVKTLSLDRGQKEATPQMVMAIAAQ